MFGRVAGARLAVPEDDVDVGPGRRREGGPEEAGTSPFSAGCVASDRRIKAWPAPELGVAVAGGLADVPFGGSGSDASEFADIIFGQRTNIEVIDVQVA